MAFMRGATLEDCYELAPKLRKEDIEEIKANANYKPEDALIQGFQFSEVPLVIANEKDEVVSMFGCCPITNTPSALVWLLASDGLQKISKPFLRNNRMVIDIFQKRYPILYNFVDVRNTLHIRWLKWCGFTFINKHEQFGFERKPFYEFIRI